MIHCKSALVPCLCLGMILSSLTACVTTETGKPKANPQKALEANVKLGMTYLQRDNRDNALRSFLKALKIDKNSAEANHGLALVRQRNGEMKEAEISFKKALASRSDFSRSSIEFSYGRFLLENKRYDEAIDFFYTASDDLAYSRRADAKYFVGLCALNMGDVPRAKGAFQHALNLNPEQAQAALELADIAFSERKYAQSKALLDQFSSISPHTSRSLWLGVRIERTFDNKDKEASYGLMLRNMHPYSQEYLKYKRFIEQAQ